MAEPITRDAFVELLGIENQTCLSLYMPTHRTFPDRTQDAIRYKNLVRHLREQLIAQQPAADHETILQPFEALIDDHDFWIYQRDAIAVLGGENFFHVFSVQRPVVERVEVNHRPYLTPLLRILQSADHYQVLCLSRDSVRLFEGNRDVLDEVELNPAVPRTQVEALGEELTPGNQSGFPNGFSRASNRGDPAMHEAGGSGKQDEADHDRDRFFRAVDRAITAHHSKRARLPLLLAALPENQSFFRALSHNPHLVESGIALDARAPDLEVLRQRSWEIMQHRYRERLQGILEQYGTSHGQGLATDQLSEIEAASLAGRVATLLIEADRGADAIDLADSTAVTESSDADTQHLLDEVMVHALQNGGDVVVVPAELMPSKTGAAAVFRF